MKLIVSGGRSFEANDLHFAAMERIFDFNQITEVVSGGARGADQFGEEYAKMRDIPIKQFLPEWDRLGKVAGFKRNFDMAKYADAVVIFAGGKGTAHMLKVAKEQKLHIFNYSMLG